MQGVSGSCFNTIFNYCASNSQPDSGRKGYDNRVFKMNQGASLQRTVAVKPDADLSIRRR